MDELKAAKGEELGTSEWHEIDQDAVNAFADVTGDHQWIHIDVERAKDTPFGGTIVHGYFTLSLVPVLAAEIASFEGFSFALNYGLGKVRFPAPLPVGAKVRATGKITEVEDVSGGVQVTQLMTFEREGGDKPVCVAETLARFYS
jgi:acyl dehydratase